MSRASLTKREILRERAQMLSRARSFFEEKQLLEVDCPACCRFPPLDPHIDPLCVMPLCVVDGSSKRWLHTSPEYGMKRLLAEGVGDIYQISHVFRAGERGRRHNPEFTMVEWYRCGFSLEAMIEETFDFLTLALGGEKEKKRLTYREALLRHAGFDYTTITKKVLLELLEPLHLSSPLLSHSSFDDLLQIAMDALVEPKLVGEGLVAIFHYPASQAALAESCLEEGIPIAKRFEIYYEGQELANGYEELRDGEEQKSRLLSANEERTRRGKSSLPIDIDFLASIDRLPPCCGVAVGFDRLLTLRLKVEEIGQVLPFPWEEA